MADPFLGEIKIFAGNFAPRGWAFCNGALYPIAQNAALFSLLGTTYGGDGRTSFGVPDMRGRAAMHYGTGAGLTPRRLGERGGETTVTLTSAQLPNHQHSLPVGAPPIDDDVADRHLANARGSFAFVVGGGVDAVNMSGAAVTHTGNGQAHENRQPFLGLNFIIATTGVYPSRQ